MFVPMVIAASGAASSLVYLLATVCAVCIAGDILDSGPVANGLDSGIWTSPMIAWVIETEFGIQYHPGHVRKLLHGWGFSVQRPRRVLARRRCGARPMAPQHLSRPKKKPERDAWRSS